MTKTCQTLALLAVLLFPYSGQAMINYDNVRFRQLNISDELPNKIITSIVQDDRGFIWIGTQNGLCKYDGYRIERFNHDPADSNSIFHDYIIGLQNDSGNHLLWIATDINFGCYDYRTEKFKEYRIGGTSRRYVDFTVTSGGDILLSTLNGIYIYDRDGDRFCDFIQRDGGNFGRIAEDRNSTLWIQCDNNLLRYDLRNKCFLPIPTALAEFDGKVEYLHPIDSNRFIFSAHNDIYLFGTASGGHVGKLDTGIDSKGFRCACKDAQGNIWIGSEFGIFVFGQDSRLIAHYDKTPTDRSNLNDSPIYSIFRDRDQNMWVGTYFGGINYYVAKTDGFHVYGFGNSNRHLSGKAVRQIMHDRNGGLLITTEDGGLNYMDKDRNIIRSDAIHRKFNLKNVKNVHSLLIDSDRNLWVGLFLKSLIRFSPKSGKTVNFNEYIQRNYGNTSAFTIFESQEGKIWYAGPEGLFTIDPRNGYRPKFVFRDHFFCSIEMDDSTVWLGNRYDGIYRLDTRTEEIRKISKLSGIILFASYMYRDSRDRIWMATNNNGLFVTDDKAEILFRYDSRTLETNSIKGIVEDNLGNMWVGTDNGLCKIDSHGNICRYTVSDGLPTNQFNFSSAHKMPDGELYFGTINGMISFFPEDITPPEDRFRVRVTNIWSNNRKLSPLSEGGMEKSLSYVKAITLTHEQARSVTIEYSGMNFRYDKDTQYALMLEGIDKDWQFVGTQHQIRFSNLPSGRYTLRIKASPDNRNWDENGILTLPVRIKAPWWASGGGVPGLSGRPAVHYHTDLPICQIPASARNEAQGGEREASEHRKTQSAED